MASTPPIAPDPRTAADDDEDATTLPNAGVSAEAPAEGGDDAPGEQPGSPAG
ncbi:hypothetical protein [uncultured Sphingomonas sp.]|uniref:hypothetical protein n=1 Tax=uncultured Sphingomonas sp. TaxID=158754 RepID=UPI0035CAE81E